MPKIFDRNKLSNYMILNFLRHLRGIKNHELTMIKIHFTVCTLTVDAKISKYTLLMNRFSAACESDTRNSNSGE